MEQYGCPEGIWDEMCDAQKIRDQYSKVFAVLQNLDVDALHQKDRLASELFMNQGINFYRV